MATRSPTSDASRRARRSSSRARRATRCTCLLNGVLVVEVDGEKIAELGPGAVFGERAVLEAALALQRCAPSPMQGRGRAGGSDRPRQARRARRRAPP